MDTQFAKIVTDAHGRDHILIEGHLVSLDAPLQRNNELVDTIVRGLRSRGEESGGVVQASTSQAGG